MEVGVRIQQLMTNKGITAYNVSKETGISQATLSRILNKGRKPNINSLAILAKYFNVNPDWLRTGKGSMLREPPTASPQATSTEAVSLSEKTNPNALVESEHGIPLVPIDAVAGFGKGVFTDLPMERYNVPEFMRMRAEFMIYVNGDSMQPSYRSGDLVACKMSALSDSFFLWNRVYVVVSEEGVFIKHVQKSKQEGNILLVSENTAYEPIELPKKEIYSLALVVGSIRVEG